MQIKTCTKCKLPKDLSEFHKDKKGKYGTTAKCKACVIEYQTNNKHKIKEYQLKYYRENKDNKLAYIKQYTNNNKNKVSKYQKEYRLKNKERISSYQKEYRLKNKERGNSYQRGYRFNKRNTDPSYRILESLRARIGTAIKSQNTNKWYNSCKLLGCTIEECREHLESQFSEGMTWDNYGEWHVDHIKPCTSFDLTYPEQQKECFHYTNLQPLWAKDNLIKGSKIK